MKCWVLSVFDHWFPVLGQGDQVDIIIIVPYKEVKIILYIYFIAYVCFRSELRRACCLRHKLILNKDKHKKKICSSEQISDTPWPPKTQGC